MRTLLVLSAAIVVMVFATIEVRTKIKDFFHDDEISKGINRRSLKWKKADQTFKGIKIGARRKRQVLKRHRYPNMTWQDGVFYTFNTSDYIVQKMFKMGTKAWTEATCIDFVEDRHAKDKVVVVSEGSSWSRIGRQGGDQLLSLSANATKGSAMHEIGHALGFFHTMQRFDRNDYITIAKENLDPGEVTQLIRLSTNMTDVYGLAYDYGSIMHYNELSFSLNGQPTMVARDPYYQKTMGSDLISFSDIFTINEHYGCNAICNKSTSAKCANEGFPHPRNCSVCICPRGYGGVLCDRRPPGCGEDLAATSEKKMSAFRLGSGSGPKDDFDFCNYMITAPEGKRIEIEVYSISRGYEKAGCPMGGVEVKAQKDQKMTGYRFCSFTGSGGPIVSSSNRLPVIVFNRQGMIHGLLMYRYTD